MSSRVLATALLAGSLGLFIGPVEAALVLNDTLQGSTIGTREGGSFVTGGWQVTTQYNTIYWHVGTFSKGAFEYNLKGTGDACSGGLAQKNELSHMYDYTFGNADIVYSGGYRDDPYKHFIRKQCYSPKERTLEIVWAVPGGFFESDSGALSWDSNTNYLWRTEWENIGGNSVLKIFRNGPLVFQGQVAGSWTPAGQSVRIAASPRRADEGAHVGGIYSNVKVYDLSGALPGAPVITSPTNAETINTTIAYVQWTGDSHTQYQVRVNTQNNPDQGVIWDSQEVTSTRDFTWTGALTNNVSYYAFARLATGDWGPWSTGRLFTVNTSFVPGGIDYIKVKGNSYANKSGPFLGLGFTHMRAMQRCKYDRPRFESDCAFMASKNYTYQRDLSMVSWCGLEIAPISHTNSCGTFIPAWPDYWQQFRDHIDIAYNYGLKTEITIFAGAQECMPNKPDRFTHMDSILANMPGREHKIVLIEVGNELWQNGVNDADTHEFGQYLADRTVIPIALSAPADSSDAGIVAYYAGSAADIATVHFTRDNGTVEGGWLPVRDCYRTGVGAIAPIPISSNEPIGAGSSVSTELDPIKLCMAGCFAWNANLISYVYHSRAGVFAWEFCCPPSGQERPFSTSPGVDSYMNILPLLPKDLASWERNDGKATASPFTSYSMGQANKWWTEVGGSTNGCVRNISAIKGGEFVTTPIGILGGGLELEARRPMSFQVYNPLTGAVAYNLTKNTGEHFTLTQGPAAYVIMGVFTDIVGPATEVSIDLGNPDVPIGMTHPPVGDGDTVAFTIGGRTGRKNVNAAEDYYFYFGVSDAFAYQGSKPDLYILMDYYDTGTNSLTLQYDATAAAYTVGDSVTLTNTNTWKTKIFHVTDAYFGNRQNAGADFRIFGGVGNTFYLDTIIVTTQTPGPPIIAEVSPDPDLIYPGSVYNKQLTLTQGYPAPTWSVVQSPAGGQVNAAGLVTGWTPSAGSFGDNTFEIQASNAQGSDTESWIVRVLSRFDYDLDGDADSSDFGHMQKCFSGETIPYAPGCNDADSNGDGDVDTFDFNSFLPCMAGANNLPGC